MGLKPPPFVDASLHQKVGPALGRWHRREVLPRRRSWCWRLGARRPPSWAGPELRRAVWGLGGWRVGLGGSCFCCNHVALQSSGSRHDCHAPARKRGSPSSGVRGFGYAVGICYGVGISGAIWGHQTFLWLSSSQRPICPICLLGPVQGPLKGRY